MPVSSGAFEFFPLCHRMENESKNATHHHHRFFYVAARRSRLRLTIACIHHIHTYIHMYDNIIIKLSPLWNGDPYLPRRNRMQMRTSNTTAIAAIHFVVIHLFLIYTMWMFCVLVILVFLTGFCLLISLCFSHIFSLCLVTVYLPACAESVEIPPLVTNQRVDERSIFLL